MVSVSVSVLMVVLVVLVGGVGGCCCERAAITGFSFHVASHVGVELPTTPPRPALDD